MTKFSKYSSNTGKKRKGKRRKANYLIFGKKTIKTNDHKIFSLTHLTK